VNSSWRVPAAPLRSSAVASTLIGLIIVLALANVARTMVPQLGDYYAAKAGVLFVAVMGLSIGFLQQHHPFSRFGAANQITTLRAVLVSLVAGLVGEARLPRVAAAAVVASVAVTALDGVDGWLARRNGIASPFGARFDMEIDALLILALSALAWRHDKTGAWVIASGLMRYAFIGAGSIASWMRAVLPPSRRRQAICVVQIAALTLVMVPAVQPPASAAIAAAALVALTVSFLIDTMWLWRQHEA
jgi:phosphatidylglycerophosphate synthase